MSNATFRICFFFILGIFFTPVCLAANLCPSLKHHLNSQETKQTLSYIQKSWVRLTRSHHQIVQAAIDPKIPPPQDGKWIVYIPSNFSIEKISRELKMEISDLEFNKIKIKKLPLNYNQIKQHGLLYLPNPYVVPGGQYNEMYGWDSYFIILGLLEDGYFPLAKGMVENFIFEIENYGKILNANRSYYLSRSQPPLFSEMVLAIYNKSKNKAWLKQALPAILKYYNYWVSPPHLIPKLGLSRYYDEGNDPAPEVLYNKDSSNYYDRIKKYFQSHIVQNYNLADYYDAKTNRLTPLFFISDRSVRESGFDVSNEYGAFSADIINYAPVGLNSLLHQMEKDIATIYEILGNRNKSISWNLIAKRRAELMNHYMWDDALGYYFDYNFKNHQTRPYIYATTFWPLWTGIANTSQAFKIYRNMPFLESQGGLMPSTYVTGQQWDAPFIWAPLQYFAVKGLLNYGFTDSAKDLTKKYISLINLNLLKFGVIFEKYDGKSCSPQLTISQKNQIGFGWTNGVYIELLSLTK